MENIILVCGGRFWGNKTLTDKALYSLPMKCDLLIHGGAKGADSMAGQWAKENGIHVAQVDALWNFYGKPAGYKRNSAMLLLRPVYCVAFPGGRGTKSMIDLCEKAGVPVWTPFG